MGNRGRRASSGTNKEQTKIRITEKQIIDDLLQCGGFDNFPRDVDQIIHNLGISVCEDSDLPPETSGYLKKDGEKWIIGVNPKHSKRRQRFTKAHELGHYLMHRKNGQEELPFEDKILFRNEIYFDPKEHQANTFAAEVLMPAGEVKKLVQSGVRSVEKLADHFGVSITAMKFQLLSIGYEIK